MFFYTARTAAPILSAATVPARSGAATGILMLVSSTTQWIAAPGADLRWRIWDQQVVVFHPPSGDTHILNPLAAEALRHLGDGPASAGQLTEHIAALFELQADGELHRQMEQCLTQFAELGLIEPAPVAGEVAAHAAHAANEAKGPADA